MENTKESQNVKEPAKQPIKQRWARLVAYINRKMSERKSNKEKEAAQDKAARITARATVWIAGFTIVIAGVGCYQYHVMGAQLDVMRKDQRPWISGSNVKISSVPNGPIIASVSLTNVGKTPARRFEAKMVITMIKNGDSPALTYSDHPVQDETAGIIFPSEPNEIKIPLIRVNPNGTFVPWVMTATEIEDFDKGNSFFEAYGEVTYLDQYKTPHWLHFCQFATTTKVPTYVTARKCTDYNDGDNN